MNINSFYSLDYYFDSFKKQRVFCNQSIVNCYPNLADLVSYYEKKLSYFSSHEILNEIHHQTFNSLSETYVKEVIFPNKNFYAIYWNIDKANSLIRHKSLKPVKIAIHRIINSVSFENIVPDRLKNAASNANPIILAEYTQFEKANIVIDGSHRVVNKFYEGKTEIMAFTLPPNLHLQVMTHDLFRVLIQIHNNSNIIIFT